MNAMNGRKVKMNQAEVLRKAEHKQWGIAEMLGVTDEKRKFLTDVDKVN